MSAAERVEMSVPGPKASLAKLAAVVTKTADRAAVGFRTAQVGHLR